MSCTIFIGSYTLQFWVEKFSNVSTVFYSIKNFPYTHAYMLPHTHTHIQSYIGPASFGSMLANGSQIFITAILFLYYLNFIVSMTMMPTICLVADKWIYLE